MDNYLYKTLIFFVVFIFIYNDSHGQTSGQLSPRSPDWIKHHTRGEIAQGLYKRNYNQTIPFELISFVAYFESYSPFERQVLQIRFYTPRIFTCFLKAEELIIEDNYWMEWVNNTSKAGWNELGNWKVDPYLGRYKLHQEMIGVVVWLQGDVPNLVTPAIIFHSKQPDKINRYSGEIRLGTTVNKVRYHIYDKLSRKPLITYETEKEYYQDDVFPFNINVEKLGKSEGWFTIEFFFIRKKNDQEEKFSFTFFHQPHLKN